MERLHKLRVEMTNRPFTTAVIVILAIVVPGFFAIEDTATEAHDAAVSAEETAAELAVTEARESAEEEQEALLSCQTRNTFQQNTRDKFISFNNAIELAFTGNPSQTPERAEATRRFIEQLRESVESNPEEEDRDCNADGVFDEADYLP